MCGIYNALAHCCQIFVLVNPAPVHTAFERATEHQVKPDACAASIAFHKWMNHVHLNVLVCDFIESGFRHTLNRRNDSREV